MDIRLKTFSDTYIYNKTNDENGSMGRDLIDYIRTSARINVASSAFENIRNMVKARQTNSVIYRVLMNRDVVLCVGRKEAPASFKVFRAKDLLSDKRENKIFVDCTGLFRLGNDGIYSCKEIDKFCSYLLMALVNLLYFDHNTNLIDDSIIDKSSTACFVRLFTAVLDNMRVSNFAENRTKIAYMAGVYYLYTVVGKSMDSARSYSANVTGINLKDASGYDYWYQLEDLQNIDTFITFLANTFKLKDLNTSVYLMRFMQMYGKGTIFGLELMPSFVSIITNADGGSFINNQKTILKLCGRDVVTLSNQIYKLGNEFYTTGFSYSSDQNREFYDSKLV